MRVVDEGHGVLLGWHDPDENRRWVREHKSRRLVDKRMSVSDAVTQFVDDGALIVFGGFGHIRIPMALVYEIIRQRKRDLALAAKPGCHDSDLLIAAGCVTTVEVAYGFGHELRGLSPASRRAVQTGRCEVVAEISNAAFQWRLLAAMMGVPFVPSRVLLGTDTFKHSACKVVEDPYSRKRVCLIPACYPDVAMIHVHRCDVFGNSQIDGILVDDFELSRAARRVIVTTEQIVDEAVIRETPWHTVIPFYLVDAVIEVPYGAHPCQMPLMYFSDEAHIGEWLRLSRTTEGLARYFDQYVYGVPGFSEYLRCVLDDEKRAYLRDVEQLKASMKAPWRRR
jgi:3-oxoacid CoA-transferase subunit A/glutaconate CoA-transferase subunit A